MRLIAHLSSLLLLASTIASAFTLPSLHDVPLPPSILLRRQASATHKTNTTTRLETTLLTTCTTALSLLAGKPDSLSGISLCYNVLSLNSSTGVFRSDLRLFRVSAPRERWANISLQDIVPRVTWRGSAASLVGGVNGGRSGSGNGTAVLGRRAEETTFAKRAEKNDEAPELKKGYTFIGQINPQFLNRSMNATTLQALLLPLVTLSVTPSVTNHTNTNLTTTLSPLEASFLINVFSASPLTTTHIFALPGVTIKIFPIGLLITSSWTLVFAIVVGWGAVGKMGFRAHYRRRVARDVAAGRRGGI